MIAQIKQRKSKAKSQVLHIRFLAMLPAIRRQAHIAFREARPQLRKGWFKKWSAVLSRPMRDSLNSARKSWRFSIRWRDSQSAKSAPAENWATRCGFAKSRRNTPSDTMASKSSGSITSTMRRTAGRRSSWRTSGQRRLTSPRAGSTLRVGSGCCRVCAGRLHWPWPAAKLRVPPRRSSALRRRGSPSFGNG
jgi:hypothetical protein